MLFNSYEFILLFLPITLLVFHLIGKQGERRLAIAWLVGASLFFYGWWNPAYLILMLFSILFNYGIGISLGLSRVFSKKIILAFGIIVNLSVLGYYKYANFFVDNLNAISNADIVFEQVILPLAISFFTFQQVAYLVDTFKGETREYSFLHYCLFVTFFPQLIAGPIVHHKEMLPQFEKDSLYRLRADNLAIGFTIFAIGLFKKVMIADSISAYATPVFSAAEIGVVLTFFEAWTGSIAYSLQLYFDFSGYSDMAIGLARMFGIRLPVNFSSPYKSTSVIEFWRRWHITLSRFLRDYLYIPLGGNRGGKLKRHKNLMITMILGGLWHGAGWTYIIWGGLHGLYLLINHSWVEFRRLLFNGRKYPDIFRKIGWILTIIAIVIAWVPFRAESFEGAISILTSMSGLNGIGGDSPKQFIIAIILLIITTIIPPNTQQIMKNYTPVLESHDIDQVNKYLQWKPTALWSIAVSLIFITSLFSLSEKSEFLYFQF